MEDESSSASSLCSVSSSTYLANDAELNISKNFELNTKDSDNSKISFVEEIKENLKNVARDLMLQRNQTTILNETEELAKAIELKQAEVNNNNEIVCIECKEHFDDMQLFLRHRNRHQGRSIIFVSMLLRI